MDIGSHEAARQPDDGDAGLHRLGPPGWDEFTAARRRFEVSLKVQGLERAWSAPAAEGLGRGAGDTARTWP